MKKVIVLLAVGFAFTYCNPSQQAEQTTTDSSGTRMQDATMSPATTDSMNPSMPSDTTHHPDSTNH